MIGVSTTIISRLSTHSQWKTDKPDATGLIESQPIETLAEFERATDFKGFEALHNTILDINDQFHCSDVQTKVGQMFDEL